MDNRIDVDQVIQDSRKKEQLKYIIISVTGIVILFSLWIFYFNKLESASWRGFFTVVLLILMGVLFVFGVAKLISVNSKEKKYRSVLTKYASLIEKVQIPETALITKCLHSGVGRFGFDTVKYHFWKDNEELVFYPVRPVYKTVKDYDLVQAVRLDTSMVRSFYVTGEKFSVVQTPELQNSNSDNNDITTSKEKKAAPVYKDTRATIISYAVGEQTVYLTFSLNLHSRLKEILPEKDKEQVEKVEKQTAENLEVLKETVQKKEEFVEEIDKLQALRDDNKVTEEEFQEEKDKLVKHL